MDINQLVSKYLQQNYNKTDSRNLAAEEIILSKIFFSPLSKHVTLKGGIVMFALTNKQRSVTKDIDFDFISFPITEDSILSFINSLNCDNDDIVISLADKITPLKHEDYHGMRVPLSIKDNFDNKLLIKVDIGVHTYKNISQRKIEVLKFDSGKRLVLNANPSEQIIAEKLVALARFGNRTTRYKDIFDIYYLLSNKMVNDSLLMETIQIVCSHFKEDFLTFTKFKNNIHEVLDDKKFEQRFRKAKNNWINVDYQTIKNYILNYLETFDDVCTNVCTNKVNL